MTVKQGLSKRNTMPAIHVIFDFLVTMLEKAKSIMAEKGSYRNKQTKKLELSERQKLSRQGLG